MSIPAIWLLITPLLLFRIHGTFLLSIALYFVLPAIYFCLKSPKLIARASITAICSLPIVTFFDGIALANHAWTVTTVFSHRAFGLIPMEDYLFTFFACFAVVVSLGSRWHEAAERPIRLRRSIEVFGIALLFACIFYVAYKWQPFFFGIRYTYLWILVTVFVVPSLWLATRRTKMFMDIMNFVPFLFAVMLLYEITALHLGWWSFPSYDYVWVITFAGVRFPVEELLCWMVLFLPAILSFALVVT